MLQHHLPPLPCRCLDRKRNLQRRLAPAAVVHGLLAGANCRREIVENIAASAETRSLWQRDLAPAVLSVDQDTIGRTAQLAARAGRDREAEMRLMGRLAVVSRSVDEGGSAQLGLVARTGRKCASRRAMGRLLWAAALGNPVVQFVAVEEIIAAVD